MNNSTYKFSSWSRVFAVFIFLANVFYFLQRTVDLSNIPEGKDGFALLFIPVTFSINLLLIPVMLTVKKRFAENDWIFTILLLGFCWTLLWVFIGI